MIRSTLLLIIVPALTAGGLVRAAEKLESFFVIVDDAPIRDAATGKPLGTIERGSWLDRWPGEKSFNCYEAYNKRVTLDARHYLPADEASRFFLKRIDDRATADDYADRAAVAMRSRSLSMAKADLDRALKLDPKHFRALRRRADYFEQMMYQAGDYAEIRRIARLGMEDADRCVELYPGRFLSYDCRYRLRAFAFDAQAAIDDIKKAIELRPDHAPLYNNRGNYLSGLGRSEEALADFDRAIAMYPEYSDAHTNRGIIFHNRRQYDTAIEEATLAIKFNPENRSAWNNRGEAYVELKQFDKAVPDFTEVIRLVPDLSDGYVGRANVYYAMGDDADDVEYVRKGLSVPSGERKGTPSFRKALQDCDMAVERNPRDFKCLNIKGNVLKKLNRPKEAIETYASAMREIERESRSIGYTVNDEEGRSHEVWPAVEKTLTFAERPEVFDPQLHRIALAHPQRITIASLLSNRADAYRMLLEDPKNPDTSAGTPMFHDLTRATLFDPKNPDYFRVRGICNLEFKDWEQAVADLTRAIQLRPNFVDAYRGRIRAWIELQRYDEAWTDVRELEKLGSPLERPTLERLKKASGRNE